jgi:hypothetical protein
VDEALVPALLIRVKFGRPPLGTTFVVDSSQSIDHARAQVRDIESFLYYQKHLC